MLGGGVDILDLRTIAPWDRDAVLEVLTGRAYLSNTNPFIPQFFLYKLLAFAGSLAPEMPGVSYLGGTILNPEVNGTF